ncbi:RidA family protein [Kerstersia gyiorum]|uniref:Enamine deaminase RidA (YjgF/YER057c/UK114 family) n=1 Tax=Kerstersia gyiorum TaxID=206506 RepID=A0A171KWJ4_9BURK|nr:RidA family protein [Kerstersia gyiorum]KKO73261.1 hypothetical protein AAV32_03045 [Kerstersia gyiorum]
MQTHFRRQLIPAALIAAALVHTPASATGITRHASGNPQSPIAAATEVAPGLATVYLSGQVPSVQNQDAPPTSAAAFGDTKTQTISVLGKIKSQLAALGLGLEDVVKVQAYLVADPATGKMDFAGFSAGYAEFFGGSPAILNARSTMQVAGLVNPGWLVEIEVTAVKRP